MEKKTKVNLPFNLILSRRAIVKEQEVVVLLAGSS